MTQQADTSSEDWRRLQSSLPDLASLADIHDDDKIRKLARRLRKLVATHGVILEQSSNIKSKCKEMSDRTDQIHALADRGACFYDVGIEWGRGRFAKSQLNN